MILFSTHQPQSHERTFGSAQQINMCKAVVHEGTRFANRDAHKIGFGFGGDANFIIGPWTTAWNETASARLTFRDLHFLWGVNKKVGDLMVGAGTKRPFLLRK